MQKLDCDPVVRSRIGCYGELREAAFLGEHADAVFDADLKVPDWVSLHVFDTHVDITSRGETELGCEQERQHELADSQCHLQRFPDDPP